MKLSNIIYLLIFIKLTNEFKILNLNHYNVNDVGIENNQFIRNNSIFCNFYKNKMYIYTTNNNITKYLKQCYRLIFYSNYNCITYNFLYINHYKTNNILNNKIDDILNNKCLNIVSYFNNIGKECNYYFSGDLLNRYINKIRISTFKNIFGHEYVIEGNNLFNKFIKEKKNEGIIDSIINYFKKSNYTYTKYFSINNYILHILKYNNKNNITKINNVFNFKNIGLINKFITTNEICDKAPFYTDMKSFEYFVGNKKSNIINNPHFKIKFVLL